MMKITIINGIYLYLGVCYIVGMYYTYRYKKALNKYYFEIPFLSTFYYKVGKMVLIFLWLISFISVPVMLGMDIKDYLTGVNNG